MSFVHLSREQAFAPGAELWIFADPASSRAAALLDWRLNFLAARARAREPRGLPPQLQDIARRWDYDPPRLAMPEGSPLLIESGRFVPCRSAAMIAWTGDARLWAVQARAAWEGMGRPKMRAFLPSGLAASSFEAEWQKALREGRERGDGLGARAGGEPGEPVEVASDRDFETSQRGVDGT